MKVTLPEIQKKKGQEKLVVVTAYDYTFASLCDEHVDIVLVGDSLGMVVQGEPNTLSVTVEEMIYHGRAVAKGLKHAHLVIDLPFMSYQVSAEQALKNAGRLLSEGKGEAVKLEGGVAMADTIFRLSQIGIPVMGHVGLTPQSVHQMGGFKVQGKTEAQQEKIFQDALVVEQAGAYAVVLEGIPQTLANRITEQLSIPTIGIGAGNGCDGQVLVCTDLLGMSPDFRPKFVRHFADGAGMTKAALLCYAQAVKTGEFPAKENSF